MTGRETVAGLIAVALAIVGMAFADAWGKQADERPPGTPRTCAQALGIHWTPEDGATERLNAFEACVAGELRP